MLQRIFVLLALMLAGFALAQGDTVCKVVSWVVILLGQGPIISFLVSAMKKIPYVASHPKVVVAALNTIVALIAGVSVCGLNLEQIVLQVIAGFAGSALTYEYVTKPVAKALGTDGREQP